MSGLTRRQIRLRSRAKSQTNVENEDAVDGDGDGDGHEHPNDNSVEMTRDEADGVTGRSDEMKEAASFIDEGIEIEHMQFVCCPSRRTQA